MSEETELLEDELEVEGPEVEPAGLDPTWQRLLRCDPGRLLWIAGSTHHGEEAAVLDAYQRLKPRFGRLGLLVAPRHPERADEVERLVRDRGLRAVRRTAFGAAEDGEAVIILDTVGELAGLYGLADVVFVGGSLVPTGGHNMLEPAQRRKPVLFGPHTSNFRESAELLRSAAIVLIGGLLTSTLLTLFFVPAMFTVFDDAQRGVARLLRRGPGTTE